MCWGWCVDGRGWRAVVTYAVGGRCGGGRGCVASDERVDCRGGVVKRYRRGSRKSQQAAKFLQRSCFQPRDLEKSLLMPQKDAHKCSQLNPRPSPTASQSTKTARRTDESDRKDLSDIPPNPPSTAGRSQTLYWVEIIAAQQAAHVGITLGLGASAHQPGWSLWLM